MLPPLGTRGFCQRLQERREELGMSAGMLGKLVGNTRQTILSYETPRVGSFPQIAKVVQLAQALEVRPEWLAFGITAIGNVEPDCDHFAERLISARICCGLMTQHELSDLSHVTQPAISYYEAKINKPTLRTAERLASAVKKTPEWLTFGIEIDPVHRSRMVALLRMRRKHERKAR